MKKLLVMTLILIAVLMVGCKPVSEDSEMAAEAVVETLVSTEVPEATEVVPEESEPTATEVVVEATATTVEESQEEMTPTPLPALPLDVNFDADDGTFLMGEFFPPASPDAPIVVLLHQYNMDHNVEWLAVAPWIQNRGLTEAVRTSSQAWADASWFPQMIEGADFGVFSFTFRNCIGGCSSSSVESREEWIVDAVSGIKAAGSFTSVDSQKVIVIGTSIGADAAVNACERLLEDEKTSCVGVISLSPGNFLGEDYAESVQKLDEAGVPVQCVATENDGSSAETCLSYEGENYESFVVSGNQHGIYLFDPDLELDLPGLIAGSLINWGYVK